MSFFVSFYFKHATPTKIYTLSLHDALPILIAIRQVQRQQGNIAEMDEHVGVMRRRRVRIEQHDRDLFVHLDRKSTRLNSSHANISYAVICLKKKGGNRHPVPTHAQ